ncbi:MAG: glutamate 5-kinase [Chloroflexota bacterium]
MRVVIKFGTNIVASENNTVNRARLLEMVRQMAQLHEKGHQIILVSSGAIFVGRQAVDAIPSRKDIPYKQMLAAIGQVKLLHIYEQLFDIYNITIGQALLTRDDLSNRTRYLNARNTLSLLLDKGIVPIINENDVVGVEEIRIGDNDNLSALIANLVDADLLLILTDQKGLFTADPRKHKTAELIPEVTSITESLRQLASGSGTNMGVGGMITKIQAAELAMRSGVDCIIAAGKEPDVILRVVDRQEKIGTHFRPKISHIESRKRWILTEPAQGNLTVDAGAKEAILQKQKSLLPVGIIDVEGQFSRGEIVVIQDQTKQPFCRGIVNYKANDITAIKGKHSDQIEPALGYNFSNTIIHRDNLVVIH